MKRSLMLLVTLTLAACGAQGEWEHDTAWHVEDSEEIDLFDPDDYLPIGEMLDFDDPDPLGDPCGDYGDCADEVPAVEVDRAASTNTSGWVPGATLLTLRYAPLRKNPSNNAGTVGTTSPSNGGASGSGHGTHPRGVVPPGQRVTLLWQPRTDGFWKVDYQGSRGWIHRNKLALVDETVHPVVFARKAAHRDAFFLHQIRRANWNKDGPSSSSNCAPTSLAMAAKIFGLDRPGRSPEQSIHAARRSYNASSDEGKGTFRWQIVKGAKNMGFDVQELGLGKTTSEEMDRIDKQLGWKRVVVLEGMPAKAYRDRMNEVYRAQGTGGYYSYDRGHSILVVARLDNGRYVVADPISEAGMVTMARSELKAFFTRWGGTGTSVYIKGL